MVTSTGHLSADTAALHLRARLLPEDRETDLWIDNGAISREPVDDARTVATGGWMLPALMDSHLHIGVAEVGGPLDLDVLERDLQELARTGVGAVRVLGSPQPLPADALARPGGPLVLTAGVPVAAPDRFIPGWGRRVSDEELPAACVAEAGHGWSKIIADWFDDEGGYGPTFSATALTAAVVAVHGRGARVAVHAQSAAAGRDAVDAGADTIEHGMHLPWSVLPDLAARGGALVPTGGVFAALASAMTDDAVPSAMRRWYADGFAAHPGLVRRAREEGVTVLAGTDLPVGALVDEIRWLIEAGLPVADAIGAASWTAREVFDLPRLRAGDRADLIWLEHDPREDVELLRTPTRVILGGREIR
ncbi:MULTISPECIES: amidohydrolase family protein [Actinoalloteichus]|uniref:Amidohydrolase, imidazolonepropionase n=1 Tax=Actinoalloteichus fjordicus TaxID=1612552 RepID=A0AAC9LBT5_9PSEU|nr:MULTISPECIES: amidohydrolase family protein [Actinoalloteichus]APU13454.1 amidohydrolase, imidazolonepropionase [Actinoalloteichus fjordicus]APU19403.1 amidohydrolase, imidazolonepropionase [Actinoalloteichus sp. GBA129-24]